MFEVSGLGFRVSGAGARFKASGSMTITPLECLCGSS